MKVFGDSYSNRYDALYGSKDYAGEIALIEAVKRKYGAQAGKRVLDLGCGTGGHSQRLAELDYDVVGVDFSSGMLARAERKRAELAGETKNRLRYIQGDVRTVKAGGVFDIAIMMFAVLGYQVENESVLSALRNVRTHLVPGGLFIADFWYGPAVLSQRPTDKVRIVGPAENQILRTTHTELNVERHLAEVRFNVWNFNGDAILSRVEELHTMRFYFYQEIALFMQMASMEIVSLTAFPSIDTPLSEGAWNALLIGRAN